MTVTYSLDVAKTRFCGFTKLLARWNGSIYKILWREFLIFCLGYVVISVTYRYYLNEQQREMFEKAVIFVDTFTDLIPLSFVLGFYVSIVVGRWWRQYEAIPWPDRLCFTIASYVQGSDERSRMIRRALGRYIILLEALTFQAVSTAFKRRFPTTQHLVAAGIMTKEEYSVYEKVTFEYGKWWLPCQWFSALAMRAKKEGRIKDSILLDGMFKELFDYRTACGTMLGYDWISVPLVYTQVVTIATYMYSIALIVGKQYLDPAKKYPSHSVDMYVPFFTLLQFFFYVGWLKVAEQIINPYGEDDDDFELNWFFDRTVHLVYLTVDHMHTKHPKLRRDAYWDERDIRLPQTKHSAKCITHPMLGSAFFLDVSDVEYLPTDILYEEDKEENIYISDSVKKRGVEGFRSSFMARIMNSRFGQSLRRKSTRRGDSVRSTNENYVNQAFAAEEDKQDPSNRTTPGISRKSSVKSVSKKVSPSHSRASSLSFRPNSLNRHWRKTYDLQEAERSQLPNGTLPFTENFGGVLPAVRTLSAPVISSTVDIDSKTESKEDDSGSDPGCQRMESLMPAIPEEPSRISSLTSNEGIKEICESSSEQTSDVQSLVRKATMVLKELNRTVLAQGNDPECKIKGYESSYSLSSSETSSDENDDRPKPNEQNPNEISIVIENNKETPGEQSVTSKALSNEKSSKSEDF